MAAAPQSHAQHPSSHSPRFFDAKTNRKLAEEDSLAWQRVTGILITIVTLGLVIGVVGVSLAVQLM